MPAITPAMMDAVTVTEMADAFHPSEFGRNAHRNTALDLAEAALLWSAGRISKRDFLSILEDQDVDA